MKIRHGATFSLMNQQTAQFLVNKSKSKSSIARILVNPKPKPSFHTFTLLRCLSSYSSNQTPCRRYVGGYSNPFVGWCRNISTGTRAEDPVLLDGCDFQHWLVVMEPPDPCLTRDDIIDNYIKTLALCLGSEDEARKSIYSVSTKHYFAFSCIVSEQLSNKIKELPKVRWVLPDSYLDVPNKTYGGEPFVNGQAVPYDPKYHERWVRNTMNSKNNYLKYKDRKRNDKDGFSARMIDRMMSNEMPSSSSHTSNPSTYPSPGPASMEPPGRYYPPFPPSQPNFPSTGSLPGFQNQNLHSNNFPSSQNNTFENRENLQVQRFGPSTGSNMYPGQTAGFPNGTNTTPVQNPGFPSRNNMSSSGLQNTHPSNIHMPPYVPNHEFHGNGMPFLGEIQPPQSRQAENLQPGFQVIPRFVPNNEFHGNGKPFHVETQHSQFRQAENLKPGFQLMPRFVPSDAFHGNGMFHVENQQPQFRQAEIFQPGFQVMPNFVPNQEFHGHGMPFHVENQQPQFRQAENFLPGYQVMPRSLPNHEFHENGMLFHVENQQPQIRQVENLQPGFQQMPRAVPNNELHSNGMFHVENQLPQSRQAEKFQPGFQVMPNFVPNHEFHGNGMPSRVEYQQPQFRQAENFQPGFRLMPRSEPNLEFDGNGMPSNVGNQQPQFRQTENLQPGFQQNRVVSMGNLPNHQNQEAPDLMRLANSHNLDYQGPNMAGNTNPIDRDIRDYSGRNMQNSPYQGRNTNPIDYQGRNRNMQNSHHQGQGQKMASFTNSFDTHNRDYQGGDMHMH